MYETDFQLSDFEWRRKKILEFEPEADVELTDEETGKVYWNGDEFMWGQFRDEFNLFCARHDGIPF